MGKFADIYLEQDPWNISEKDFHADRGRVSESLFAQANEQMGVRGYFEEGYSGDHLVGSYLNGVYEEQKTQGSSYKGVSDRLCFMVNTLDFLYYRLEFSGEVLDLASSAYSDFYRVLDFHTGLLTRSFVWKTKAGVDIELSFERFLSMDTAECARQRLRLKTRSGKGALRLVAGLDFGIIHEQSKQSFWECGPSQKLENGRVILGTSSGNKQRVAAAFTVSGLKEGADASAHVLAANAWSVNLESGHEVVIDRINAVWSPRAELMSDTELIAKVSAIIKVQQAITWEAALEKNRTYWDRVWSVSDIAIDGDPANQQGIRFGIFQLEQTYTGRMSGANIGAKGLTGEFYNGNAFWDTEVYCLPYYLFTNPAAARSLLEYRYRTLPQALERAKMLDCEGACYPVATIDGTESCTLWQHASLQFQPTTAVAYALWNYAHSTGDAAYLYGKGLEMLIQIARFLASRVQFSERKQAWGYYAVMGPDEFQMMVNHNAYTNYMGKRSLEFALETLETARKIDPKAVGALEKQLNLKDSELTKWRDIAARMYLPHDDKTGIYEQHEGFFDLPHIDIASIPPEDFPLYHSWSYDRIYRNDMIKQPDVLMFMLLYNQSFSLEEKRANYRYYEPRCIHESSLSPSVHSILAAELGREEEAYRLFGFATRIDLDNYNRNTREGLHLTSIAAAWMNIVYGFGGFRPDGASPSLSPWIPDSWQSCRFALRWKGSLIRVEIGKTEIKLIHAEGPALQVKVYGKDFNLKPGADELIPRQKVGV